MDRSYIRGFFDGEGSIGLYTAGSKVHHRALHPQWDISNTSLTIIVCIKEFLEDNGYSPLLIKKAIRGKYKQCYVIRLKRWNDILRVIDEIGTEHPEKRAKFDEIKAYSKVAKKTSERILSVGQLNKLF